VEISSGLLVLLSRLVFSWRFQSRRSSYSKAVLKSFLVYFLLGDTYGPKGFMVFGFYGCFSPLFFGFRFVALGTSGHLMMFFFFMSSFSHGSLDFRIFPWGLRVFFGQGLTYCIFLSSVFFLPRPPLSFFADSFLVKHQHLWHVKFVLNQLTVFLGVLNRFFFVCQPIPR